MSGHPEDSLNEDTYKADLEVSDRYQRFSAELLRLSLAAIAAVGFLFKDVFSVKQLDGFASALSCDEHFWIIVGFLALVVSSAFALAHRYYATDCLACRIRYLRAKAKRDTQEMAEEKRDLRRLLKLCGPLLALAVIFLALGVLSIAICFARLINGIYLVYSIVLTFVITGVVIIRYIRVKLSEPHPPHV